MTKQKPENRTFYGCTLFLRELWNQGLSHVIISPGSRSTPLTLAAASFSKLTKHVILDERSAAFTALGIGKATNQPAALICTSGTALANYFPAVIEARKSGVPMLLLTADRPVHLHGTGANQTINQHHIFGDYPVLFRDIGVPADDNFTEIKNTASKVLKCSIDHQGPVHLNFPFSKPLEPEQSFIASIFEENENIDKSPTKNRSNEVAHCHQLSDGLTANINSTQKPLLIIGQLAPGTDINHIFSLARQLNVPVLSEQGHCISKHSIQGFEGFLRNDQKRKQLEPDLILRFGCQPASKSLLQAIKGWSPKRHIHFADTEYQSDIQGTTTDFIKWNAKPFDFNKFPKRPAAWLQQWKETEEHYGQVSKSLIIKYEKLTDGAVYHHLSPKIPAGWTVSISNSFPARDHSMYGRWKNHKTYTNRGASGIDGITSTALGANIGLHQPGVLFTGDLAFLHDTNALLNHDKLTEPLVVVVINNQGGSIFRMLPIAKHKKHFNTYFETPQEADISALARTYNIHAKTVSSIAELKKINFEALNAQSDSKLHVIECKTDPDTSMELRRNIWDHKL